MCLLHFYHISAFRAKFYTLSILGAFLIASYGLDSFPTYKWLHDTSSWLCSLFKWVSFDKNYCCCGSSSSHVLLRPLVSIRISSQQLNLLSTPYTSNHHQQYFNIFYCEIPFCLPIMMKRKKTIFVKYFPKLYDAISSLGFVLLKIWFFMGIYYSFCSFFLSHSLAVLRCLCSILLCKLWVYDDISLLILTFSFSANFSLLFDFFLLLYSTTFLCSWPYANIIKVLWFIISEIIVFILFYRTSIH